MDDLEFIMGDSEFIFELIFYNCFSKPATWPVFLCNIRAGSFSTLVFGT